MPEIRPLKGFRLEDGRWIISDFADGDTISSDTVSRAIDGGEGLLGFTRDGLLRELATFDGEPIEITTLENGALALTIAVNTTGVSIQDEVLNWDQPTSTITVDVLNDSRFPEQPITILKSLTYDNLSLNEADFEDLSGSSFSRVYTALTLLDERSSFTLANARPISIVALDTQESAFSDSGTKTWGVCSFTVSASIAPFDFLDISDKTVTWNLTRSNTSVITNFPITGITTDGSSEAIADPSATSYSEAFPIYKGQETVSGTMQARATRPALIDPATPFEDFTETGVANASITYKAFAGFGPLGEALTVANAIALSALASTVQSNQVVGTQRAFNNTGAKQTLWLGLRTSDTTGISFELNISGVLYPTTQNFTQSLTLVPNGSLPSGYIGEDYTFYGFNVNAGDAIVLVIN